MYGHHAFPMGTVLFSLIFSTSACFLSFWELVRSDWWFLRMSKAQNNYTPWFCFWLFWFWRFLAFFSNCSLVFSLFDLVTWKNKITITPLKTAHSSPKTHVSICRCNWQCLVPLCHMFHGGKQVCVCTVIIQCTSWHIYNRAFAHDVTAAMLVFRFKIILIRVLDSFEHQHGCHGFCWVGPWVWFNALKFRTHANMYNGTSLQSHLNDLLLLYSK